MRAMRWGRSGRLLGVALVVLTMLGGLGVETGRAGEVVRPQGACRDVGLMVISESQSGGFWINWDGQKEYVVSRTLQIIIATSAPLEGQQLVLRAIEPWFGIAPQGYRLRPSVSGRGQVRSFGNGGLEVRWPSGAGGYQEVWLELRGRFPDRALTTLNLHARVLGGRCAATLRMSYWPL